jgi:hypothetical protein
VIDDRFDTDDHETARRIYTQYLYELGKRRVLSDWDITRIANDILQGDKS